MSLQFIDAAVYFPQQQTVKIRAISGNRLVECEIARDALLAIGCKEGDDALAVIQRFNTMRADFEIAAMAKFRRAPQSLAITIDRGDLGYVCPRASAA